MNESCLSAIAKDGNHVGEYFETAHGEVWERCINCGTLFFVRYHDTGSGC